jgi:hypothetical protein
VYLFFGLLKYLCSGYVVLSFLGLSYVFFCVLGGKNKKLTDRAKLILGFSLQSPPVIQQRFMEIP